MLGFKIRFCLLAGMFLAWATLAAGDVYAAEMPVVATVHAVSGAVQVQGEDGAWMDVQAGRTLSRGARVRTGQGGSCVIQWLRGNVVKLAPYTRIEIKQLSMNPAAGAERTEFALDAGTLYAQARKMNSSESWFSVRTPAAVAEVRGTAFSISVSDDESSTVGCLSGSVQVQGAAGGETLLGRGQKVTVRKGEKVQAPQTLSDADRDAFLAAEEVTAARLDVIQPMGNLETDRTPMMVKGTADPGNAIEILVEELEYSQTAVADSSGLFTAMVSLAPGVNSIKFAAQNEQGKTTSKTRTVKYTRDGADASSSGGSVALSITSAAQGLQTARDTVTVTGTMTPGATVLINGIPVAASPGSSTFQGQAMLSLEGENIITVTASLGSDSTSASLMVIRDTTPPMLNVQQPQSTFSGSGGSCIRAGSSLQCTLIGVTEPGAMLTINGLQYAVDSDGSFQHTITLDSTATSIQVSVQDSAGNRQTTVLRRNPTGVSAINVSVTPSTMAADGQNTATVSVQALNLLNEPVSGAAISLSATSGGSLAASSLTTDSSGTASTVFTAGVGAAINSVTITATFQGIAGTATLLLTADVPPDPGN